MSAVLTWLANKLPHTTITIAGKPYLTRAYVLLRDWKSFNVFLHRFHSSDQENEFHNHPWRWSVSFILSGGYVEYRINKRDITGTITKHVRMPLTINVIKNDVFHRVKLLDENDGVWSIFIAGCRDRDWGFLNKETRVFTDWRKNPEAIP